MNDSSDNLDPQGSKKATGGVQAALAILLTVLAIAWAGDLFRLVGLLFFPEQFYGVVLALALALAFLGFRAGKGSDRSIVPWYDKVAACIGFLASIHVALRYPVLSELLAERPTDGMVVGGIILVLIVEGLRRTVGMVLTGMVVAFLVFALTGHWVPGSLAGRNVELAQLVFYLVWDPTAILGVPMAVVSTIVLSFVFFGQVLAKSGGSTFFTEISMVLMGRFRGGPAKIAVTASALFGSISGSAVSNVVSTGVITIPLMRRGGYRAELAGAIEAVASTGGQLMPPIMGAAAFLMAEFLEIPYAEVVLAAIIPAVLYYVALFILADLEAARTGITRVPAAEIPSAWPVIKSGWHFPIPFAVLIGTLFWLNFSPELAALAAAGSMLVLGFVFGYKGRRLTVGDVIDCLRGTGQTVLDVILIGAAAGIVIGVLNISGLGFGLSLALVDLAGGNTVFLLLISAFICILLGMGMPTVGVYLLLATLIAPSLIEIGVSPMAAHLFILYFGMMSMITPPVAIAAFAAASLTGADAMKTALAATRFGWLAYVIPFLFVASPAYLMQGDVVEILLTVATACAGTWLVCIAIIGHFLRPMGGASRWVFAVAGMALLMPLSGFAGALWLNLAGLVLGSLLIGLEFSRRRRTRASC